MERGNVWESGRHSGVPEVGRKEDWEKEGLGRRVPEVGEVQAGTGNSESYQEGPESPGGDGRGVWG